MNLLTRFFILCSGSTTSVIKRTPTDINKHVGLGATIFFTGLLATLTGGYALYSVFDDMYIAIGFGIFWGLIIFNLDRYIVTSMKKSGGIMKQFGMAFPRIVLATLIALVIAVPLELRIFKKEIDKELSSIQNNMLQETRLQIDSLFELNQSDALLALNDYKNQIKAKDSIFLKRQEEFDYERLGTESERTSGNAGYGPLAREKEKQMIEANNARMKAETMLQPKIDSIENELAAIRSSKGKKFTADSKFVAAYTGFAARLQAFNNIKKGEKIIGKAALFITLLIIALETSPIFVKLISPRGPYDDVLENHEHDFIMYKKERVAAKEHRFNKNEVTREMDIYHHKKNLEKGMPPKKVVYKL